LKWQSRKNLIFAQLIAGRHLGAEVWSDEMRTRIEDEMGIETFDIIGMTESGGVGWALIAKT